SGATPSRRATSAGASVRALSILQPFVARGEDRVAHGPPDLEPRVVPLECELSLAVVVRALLVVKDRLLAQDEVPVAEMRRNQHLEAIAIREREGLPLAELRRALIPVDHHEVEGSPQALDQLPGLLVAVQATQHVSRRHRDVVLHELDADA